MLDNLRDIDETLEMAEDVIYSADHLCARGKLVLSQDWWRAQVASLAGRLAIARAELRDLILLADTENTGAET